MYGDASTLVYTVDLIFRDAATGRERFARAVYHTAEGVVWAEVVFDDGTTDVKVVEPESVRWWRDHLFPDGPPGGRGLARIVGLNGEPVLTPVQEAIRRARARRHELETVAFSGWECLAAC